MALWWVVKEGDEGRTIFVQEASSQIYAALRSGLAGHDGKLIEAHQLDAKMAKKMPKDLVGRVLNQKEAMRLLKKLG